MRLAASERQAYYRTDHHWTTWGAYNAYRAFVESRGLKAVEFSVLEPLRREAPGFYGTYFSKCKLFSAVPDTIEWYDIPVSSVTVGGEEKPGLYDAEKWGERDKHAAFLWGNSDLTVVKSENNLNHQEGRDLPRPAHQGQLWEPVRALSDLQLRRGVDGRPAQPDGRR